MRSAVCHRPGEIGPFPLLRYDDVASRGARVAEATRTGVMPPWHAAAGHGDFLDARRLWSAST